MRRYTIWCMHVNNSPDPSTSHACVDFNQAWPPAGGFELNMEHTQLEAQQLQQHGKVGAALTPANMGGRGQAFGPLAGHPLQPVTATV